MNNSELKSLIGVKDKINEQKAEYVLRFRNL